MKILQILTELGPGGAERVVLDLTEQLLARGHEVSLIALKSPPENRTVVDRFLALGVEPLFLGMDRAFQLGRLFALRRAIRRIAPDLCHSHLMHPNLCSRLALSGLGIPLVNSIHISERRSGQGIFFVLDRLTFPLCSACTAVSEASARFHEKKLGLKAGTIRVVYNGVDPVPRPEPEELEMLRRKWGVENCARIIGSVGRFDWQKGYDFLLSMLPELSARIPSGETWGIVLVGDGGEREKLKRLASAVPANLRVVLPGFMPEAAKAGWLFDVFVMPSRYEGYGLALAEAMSTGVPVVVNPVDSLPELCRFYPDSAETDFDSSANRGQAAEVIVKFAQHPRSGGTVICRRSEMAESYLGLYEKFLK